VNTLPTKYSGATKAQWKTLPVPRQPTTITFEILACISDNYLRLTTAHTQILQHYPPSPPQGGDGFDHYIFIGYKYWVRQ
jgi:hypothetical protein